jgi:hypothetical protein
LVALRNESLIHCIQARMKLQSTEDIQNLGYVLYHVDLTKHPPTEGVASPDLLSVTAVRGSHGIEVYGIEVYGIEVYGIEVYGMEVYGIEV